MGWGFVDLELSLELASVEFDYFLLFKEIRKVFPFGESDDFAFESYNIGIDVYGDSGTFESVSLDNFSADFSVSDFDHVTYSASVGCDVDDFAVDHDVLVGDKLSGLENCFGVA